ncbi:MAG TPA: SDR family NAD(P)-dependent oxidoreductase [Candidatus Acidoferrum sp.]
MKLTGNTIFITGGTSGIGRAFAEAFYNLGNQVIISGRRKGHLAEVTKANPGMQSIELNVEDPASIAAVAKKLITNYPKLNAVINNAGIMQLDDPSAAMDDAQMVSIITTNLMGPIRMTSALIEHLKKQPAAYVMTLSSGLAFTPMSGTAVYCATKAAIHSYSMSMRYKLKNSSVKVIEIVPPWVQTDLLNSKDNPNAMPLAPYIEQTMKLLGTDAAEILVERVLPLRNNAGPNEAAFVNKFNDIIAQQHEMEARSQ